MKDKTRTATIPEEKLTVVAAFVFVVGLLCGSTSLMVLAALLTALGATLHLAGFGRPVTAHFRKHRPQVRYSR